MPPNEPPTPTPQGPDEDAWTVGRLLVWTTDFLRRKGSESPRPDAEILLAHVLEWPRVQLYTHFKEPVGDRERAAYRELVRRRAEGAPVAYLVGRKEFYSLPLRVSPAVLIPRPDTETVVVEFLTLFKERDSPRALDIGTGSGAIALACLSQHPTARFLAIDRSAEALKVAADNAASLSLADRIDFREGDLFEPLADGEIFDAILSNPPYIATAEIAGLEPGVRDHEPSLALDGGPDGLSVVSRLIAEAPRWLRPGGRLILEIGSAQEGPVRDLIASQPDLEVAPTVRDAANLPRVAGAIRRS